MSEMPIEWQEVCKNLTTKHVEMIRLSQKKMKVRDEITKLSLKLEELERKMK